MSDWWCGFLLGAGFSAAILIVYLILAIAAMTMYKVWYRE